MKRRFRSIAVILAVMLALALPAAGFADFGNFSGDSDFGGGDWGGSDWGSSDWGSSDWGSSDWGSSDWGSDSSSDWGSSGWGTVVIPDGNSDDYSAGRDEDTFTPDDWGSTSGSTTSSDDSGGGFIWVVLLIIAVIVVFAIIKSKKKGSVAPGAQATIASSLRPISELIAEDPEFSEAAFTEKLGNLYVAMQNAWQAKDIDAMRAHFTDTMFNQFQRQVQTYKQNRQTNYIDRISVLGARLMGWTQDEVNDKIVARLQTRIVDYVKDDATGKIIRGSDSRELFMDYEWILVRTKGKKTVQQEGATKVTCNSCGAAVDINHSAKCEYCGAIITTSDYDWVISSIKGISQRSK